MYSYFVDSFSFVHFIHYHRIKYITLVLNQVTSYLLQNIIYDKNLVSNAKEILKRVSNYNETMKSIFILNVKLIVPT